MKEGLCRNLYGASRTSPLLRGCSGKKALAAKVRRKWQ